MHKFLLLFLFVWSFSFVVVSKYTAFECSSLTRYQKYLKKSKKGVLEKHPKCNAAAIKKAYKNDKNKQKWIQDIEGPYRAYFGHPSAIFLDCPGCVSSAPFYKRPYRSQSRYKKYVLVLSLDGGGVRGFIPAIILQYIEKKTGVPISESFDVFTGTSTGGLISLFMNTPTEGGDPAYDADDLVQMYRDLSSIIFSHPSYIRKIRGTKGYLTSMYSAKSLEQLLKKYFKNILMSQTLNPVLVTSVNALEHQPFYFSTLAKFRGASRSRFMWEGARATSAAPTYFKPYKLRTKEGVITLIDGGVGINNPSLLGILLAKNIYPKSKILLVSLSTKTNRSKTKFKSSGVFGGGALSLAKGVPNLGGIIDNLMNVPENTAEQVSKALLEAEGSIYIRIQADLSKENKIRMDDGSKKTLDKLEKIAKEVIKNNKDLKRLLAIFPSYMTSREGEKVQRNSFLKRIGFFEKKVRSSFKRRSF